jgi:predicted MFS family arabinose efflux permease
VTRANPLPWLLLAWGALGVLLHVGLARFGYGVVLPSLRTELGLGYTAGGVLNAVHLAGYLAGTLLGPGLARHLGMARLGRGAHVLVALGAVVCAMAPVGNDWGAIVLSAGRLATGLGAGAAVITIMVSVMAGVTDANRAAASVLMWTGMAVAILGCGLGAGALLQPGAWRWAFGAAALVAAVLAVGFPVPAGAPGGRPMGGAAFTLASVASARWAWLVATYGCFGLGYIAYATFAGTRLAAAEAPIRLVTGTWVTVGLATLVGSAATLWLLRRPALRPHALPVAMGLAATGCAVAALTSPAAALAGAVGVGLGMAAIPALVTAAARARSSATDYAHAFSVATAVMGLGQLAGPVLAGGLADRFGSAAAPLFAAAAYGLGALLATVDRRATR